MQSKEEYIEKYKELGTLSKVADHYGFCLESIRKHFIKLGIDYDKRKKFYQNDNFFSVDNEKSWYWAGFIAADGNIEKGSNRIKIELSTKDKRHLEKFRDDIESNYEIRDKVKINIPKLKKEKYSYSRIRFNSDKMVKGLKRFGICPAKSLIYKIPENIINHNLFPHFLRGLIDGDGSVDTGIMLCGSHESMNQIYNFLCNKLDIPKIKSGFKVIGSISIMKFSKMESAKKIINYCYKNPTVYLDRKYENSLKILELKPRKIQIDKNYFIGIYRNNPVKEVAKILNISLATVMRRAEELKISRRDNDFLNEIIVPNVKLTGKEHYQKYKVKQLENKKKFYQENKEKILKDRKSKYDKDKKAKYNKNYYKNNKEKILKQDKEYRLKNINKIRVYMNSYYKNKRAFSIHYKLKTCVSANIYYKLKDNKNKNSTIKYLPYTIEELKNHLESKFEPWMNWNNYGKYDSNTWNENDQSTWYWQIDHIKPHSEFNYTSMNDPEFISCWSLSNLRPYSAKQNFIDGVNRIRHK